MTLFGRESVERVDPSEMEQSFFLTIYSILE